MKINKLIILVVSLFTAQISLAAELNKSAPSFKLVNSQKKTRKLTDYKGKVVFINFWASWCTPCRVELPKLDELAQAYKSRKVKVVTINVDENAKAGKKLLAKLGLKNSEFETLWDRDSKVVSRYDIKAMPTSFILDHRGIIRFEHSGFHEKDPLIWRKEINGLLKKIKKPKKRKWR